MENPHPVAFDTKKKTLHAAEQNRSDVAQARTEWRERQPSLKSARLVFIDETWAKTNMVRLRGRCERGTRLIDTTPHGHWKTSTFIAALREDGLVAPAVFDGAINADLFLCYVEQVLVPTLQAGDIVVKAQDSTFVPVTLTAPHGQVTFFLDNTDNALHNFHITGGGTKSMPANHKVRFSATLAPGTYEFRLYLNNGYARMTTSPGVTVF